METHAEKSMRLSAEFRRCLIELDVPASRRLWAHMHPELPQPRSDHATLIMLHHGRTCAISMPTRLRYYSHRWCLDNGIPSALPDELRPMAERMFPVIADSVGISVNAISPLFRPIVPFVQGAMEDAVREMYPDGVREPNTVKAHMQRARERIIKQLLGNTASG